MTEIEIPIDPSIVKTEIEDNDLLADFGANHGASALDQMIQKLENGDQKKSEEEEDDKEGACLELKEVKHRGRKKTKTPEGEETKGARGKDAEYLKKEKAELKTFGLSSRPRRSVNYASIERGDEATAQSLTTEFTTGKKRGKRTRDELDGNYEDEEMKQQQQVVPLGPKGKRKYHKIKNPDKPTPMKCIQPLLPDISQMVPSYDAERPRPEFRIIGALIDDHVAVRRSSGGFRRFIGWMTDEDIDRLMSYVDENYEVPTIDVDLKRVQAIRHAWNSLTKWLRKKWEAAARLAAHESGKLIGGISMPLSEIPVTTNKERKTIRHPLATDTGIDCCSVKPTFRNVPEVMEHFMTHHDAVHFYGCQYCSTLFTNRADLVNHCCDGFNTYLMKMTMNNERVVMKSAYFFLACADCGFWLPLRMRSGQKCWPYFLAALFAHSCKGLVPCMIYFPEVLQDSELSLRMKLSLFPRVACGMPISCQECGIESFSDISEINEHFKVVHPEQTKKCFRCKEEMGTEYLHRFHMVRHFNESLLFANYLRHSATYFPPPESKRLIHYGFKKENVLVGGLDEVQMVQLSADNDGSSDFVSADEIALKQKLRNCMREDEEKTRKSRSRSVTPMDGNDYKGKNKMKMRSDLGYEHIDYDEVFGETEEETEAKKRLRKIFNNESIFEQGETLLNVEEILDTLKEEELKIENVELEQVEDKLTADFSEKFVRNVKLPLSSCVDPLKDFLLLNKVYNYCPKCKAVLYGDIETHSQKCGVDETLIRELFHPTMHPDQGIRCIDESCSIRTCSVIGLRCHAALAHGEFIEFETANSVGRYDFSLQALAPHMEYMRHDQRTRMARFTDIDVGMSICGKWVQKTPQMIKPTVTYRTKEGGPAGAGGSGGSAGDKGKLIKPYVMPRYATFDCVWCQFHSTDVQDFKAHIIKNHVHCCDLCGHAYGSRMKKSLHYCNKVVTKEQNGANMALFGTCAVCRCRFTISVLHTHILKIHFNDIQFNQTTGEILPSALDIRSERRTYQQLENPQPSLNQLPLKATDRMKMIRTDFKNQQFHGRLKSGIALVTQPSGSMVYDPPKQSHIDPRMSCYLCAMSFTATRDLDEHLAKHPEQWKECPFCQQPVGGHYDMQKHLLHHHMIRTATTMICEFCRSTAITSPCSHLIYDCKYVPKCPLCAIPSASADKLIKHMAEAHRDVLRRFECNFCAQIFITMREFYEHVCQISNNLQACACSTNKVFTTIGEYCDHFDSTHVGRQFTCAICHIPQQSFAQLAKHRMNHMHPISTATLRKIYILPRWLQPTAQAVLTNSTSAAGFNTRPVTTAMMVQKRMVAVPFSTTKPSGSTGSTAEPTMFDRLNAIIDEVKKPEVVEIVDEEDDDDIVWDKTVTKGGPTAPAAGGGGAYENDDQPPALEAMDVAEAVLAAVRVESHESSETGGKDQPGYVVDDGDDDDVVVESLKNAQKSDEIMSAPTKVVEVVDENGDEELAVVAEVENVSGVLSSSIASSSREKKFKCSKCSSSFMTNASLQKHQDSHKLDAGASTSAESLGVPIGPIMFICRNCCLAFETYRKYELHVTAHGTCQQTCKQCSGIGFNASVLGQHQQGHVAKTVYYACGTCRWRFASDLHLMEHLAMVHKVALMFFCKHCGYGSTNLNKVYTHCASTHKTDYTLLERIGACPASLFNYEPDNIQSYKFMVAKKTMIVVKPSDCAHRSLLLTNEGLVSCETCFCTQSLHSYVATSKGSTENGVTFVFSEPRDARHKRFALHAFLNKVNADTFNSYATEVPKTEARVVRIRQPLPAESRSAYGTRIIKPVTKDGAIIGTTRMMNNGGHIANALMQQPVQAHRVFLNRSTGQSVSGVITNRMPTTTVMATRASPMSDVDRQLQEITRNAATTTTGMMLASRGNRTDRCETCKQDVPTEFERKRHQMHNRTEEPWFCGLCAKSEKTEMDIVRHYYSQHLALTLRKELSMGEEQTTKPVIYDLKCPRGCEEQFVAMRTFERHLKTHQEMLPHESSMCSSMFGTEKRKCEHEKKHMEHEKMFGVEGNCCPLCGTLDMWSLPPIQTGSTSLILSHIVRHGLDYFSMCRICFQRFEEDANFDELWHHMKTSHMAEMNSVFTCECGETGMSEEETYTHLTEKHAMNMIKRSQESKKGEFVVRAGAQMAKYLEMG